MRRPRSDSISASLAAHRAQRDGVPITWPTDAVTPLPNPADAERAMLIFERILSARAPEDHRDFDAVLAASLANCSIELDKLNSLVARAGWVVGGAGRNGDKITRSPLLDPITHLTQRQLALARSLGLSGLPTDAKVIAANGRLAKEVKKTAGMVGAESLLAGYEDDFSVGSKYARD
jgi:hypothetical protein